MVGLIVNLTTESFPEFRGWPTTQYLRTFSWVVIYIYLAYIFITMDIVKGSRRGKESKILWTFSLLGPWVTMVIVAVMMISGIGFLEMPLWLLTVALYFTVSSGIFQTINHVFFPEAVLLSHIQIHRALKMYKISQKRSIRIPLVNLGMDTVLNYVQSAKATIVKDLI